ncbi:MAG: Mrr restriction system protein [Xanthomonadales bacterium]|nr:Mrr restriction system protein [Xanthomonadales bacterium]
MARQRAEFTQWLGPVLDALKALDGSGKPREVCDHIAEHCDVPTSILDATLKSGQTRPPRAGRRPAGAPRAAPGPAPGFYNQVHWARQYLVWEGLLDGSTHGVWSLTKSGYEARVDEFDARKIVAKWVKIHAAARKSAIPVTEHADDPASPELEEEEDSAILLEILKKVTPEGFERICARLLRESGFERVTVTGRPKDGGIDGYGVLQINPFVSFRVLFQCKRYKGVVSRAQVGDFRNAMIGRADKGIILTTGSFSSDARAEAEREGAPPVELVDGERLVSMFERARLGVKEKTVYEVDHAFFAGFMGSET